MITKGLTITEALTKARDEGGYATRLKTVCWKVEGNTIFCLYKHSGKDKFGFSSWGKILSSFTMKDFECKKWSHVTNLLEVG